MVNVPLRVALAPVPTPITPPGPTGDSSLLRLRYSLATRPELLPCNRPLGWIASNPTAPASPLISPATAPLHPSAGICVARTSASLWPCRGPPIRVRITVCGALWRCRRALAVKGCTCVTVAVSRLAVRAVKEGGHHKPLLATLSTAPNMTAATRRVHARCAGIVPSQSRARAIPTW